jgi:alpha-D-ribose 1-methylphosphonate 5-triphosphate synthase subunit PhnL
LCSVTQQGGEQERGSIARSFAGSYPILRLDEPAASLDDANRDIVVVLIAMARAVGAAVIATCHDALVRAAIATRVFDVTEFRQAT